MIAEHELPSIPSCLLSCRPVLHREEIIEAVDFVTDLYIFLNAVLHELIDQRDKTMAMLSYIDKRCDQLIENPRSQDTVDMFREMSKVFLDLHDLREKFDELQS